MLNENCSTLSFTLIFSQSRSRMECFTIMAIMSKQNEIYDTPALEVFEVECEGLLCVSGVEPGEGEDGSDGDSMF